MSYAKKYYDKEIKEWEKTLDSKSLKILSMIKTKHFFSKIAMSTLLGIICLVSGFSSGIYMERHKEVKFPRKQETMEYRLLDNSSRSEKLTQTYWNVIDTNKDGKFDELIGHPRATSPVYKRGNRELAGEYALDLARRVVENKNNFAKMAGNDKEFYWLCRVDDFDDDGSANKISWPRMGDKMPVYEKPMIVEMQKKADEVVLYENYILDYVRQKNLYKK